MSQLEIQILHQDYVLTCPDGRESQLREAVERVDQQFRSMCEHGKVRSRERVGILLAVNLAYENLELRNQLESLQQQISQLQSPAEEVMVDAQQERLLALEQLVQADALRASALLRQLDLALEGAAPADAGADVTTSATPHAEDAAPELVSEDADHATPAQPDVANDNSVELAAPTA